MKKPSDPAERPLYGGAVDDPVPHGDQSVCFRSRHIFRKRQNGQEEIIYV